MSLRPIFAPDEWYHCFNRGVDRRKVFLKTSEYERFLSLLFLCNTTNRLHLSDFKQKSFSELLELTTIDRSKPLVEIGAWCLMPNHVHILCKQLEENGIPLFMQKVFVGYTMYFNKKNDRVGPLFSGRFKSKHVHDDRYLKHLVAYIHMNPIELEFPEWKEGSVSVSSAREMLRRYEYSSLHAHENAHKKERLLLGDSIFQLFDEKPRIETMLQNAREYYLEYYDVKIGS